MLRGIIKRILRKGYPGVRLQRPEYDIHHSIYHSGKMPLADDEAEEGKSWQIVSDPVQGQIRRETVGENLVLELIPVQAGEYKRGSTRLFSGEKPPHEVVITNSFWMSKHPICQQVYKEISGDNPSHFKDDKRPVEMVSWYEAMEWCRKLTEKRKKEEALPEGYIFRLPTEGEWEYAAQGGSYDQSYKYSGSNDPETVAWYGGARGGNSDYMTSPIGLKAPNKLGLHDMSGNVWEWCYDWHENYPRVKKLVNPTGPDEGSHRLLRGGSWGYDHSNCLITRRDGLTPEHHYCDVGFRIVLAPALKFFKRPSRAKTKSYKQKTGT